MIVYPVIGLFFIVVFINFYYVKSNININLGNFIFNKSRLTNLRIKIIKKEI